MFFERELMRKRQIPHAAFWKITRITDFPGSRTSPYATLNALRRLPNLLACLRKKELQTRDQPKKPPNKNYGTYSAFAWRVYSARLSAAKRPTKAETADLSYGGAV